MKPQRGGIGTRRRMAHRDKQEAGKPIGDPPKNFNAAEREAWHDCMRAWPWLDKVHRRFLIEAARNTALLIACERADRRHVEQAEKYRVEVGGARTKTETKEERDERKLQERRRSYIGGGRTAKSRSDADDDGDTTPQHVRQYFPLKYRKDRSGRWVKRRTETKTKEERELDAIRASYMR